jgi:hypothetical protein
MRLPWQVSDLHPHALSLNEDALEGGMFSRHLRIDLRDMSPPPIIHRYRVVAKAGQRTETLMKNGFSGIHLTRLYDLKADVLNHPALACDLPDEIAAHWFLNGERGPWQQWLDAHWRHYETLHRSNPPRVPVKGARQVFLDDDLEEAFALRDGPQGRVKTFASLRKDQEIGWIGGSDALLAQTVAACLRRAMAIGWSKATLEVQDDDRPLWDLTSALGLEPAQEFVTWHRERNPAKRPN